MEIIATIAFIILIWLGFKATRPSNIGDFDKSLINTKILKDGKPYYYVNGALLGKACNTSAEDYHKKFVPNKDFLSGMAVGSMANTTFGTLLTAREIVGNVIQSYNEGYFSASVGSNGFYMLVSESNGLIEKVAEKYRADEITFDETVKIVAGILFSDGNGKSTIVEFDRLGDPIVKDDKHKAGVAMLYQFFYENSPSNAKVSSFLEHLGIDSFENSTKAVQSLGKAKST